MSLSFIAIVKAKEIELFGVSMPSATTLMERSRERLITDLTMDLEPTLVTSSRTNEPSILMLSGESFCTQVSDEYPVPKSSRAILTPSSRRAFQI